jgi:hypothetical protein
LKISRFGLKVVFLTLFALILLWCAYLFYKLFLFFGFSLIASIGGGAVLLVLIGYCLRVASRKLIVREVPRCPPGAPDIRRWAHRRFTLVGAYLCCGLASAVGLALLGGNLIWMHMVGGRITIDDILISTLGLLLICLGTAFTLLFYREFEFMRRNKAEVIEKIFQQAQLLGAEIPAPADH